jgi:hypothetical protein
MTGSRIELSSLPVASTEMDEISLVDSHGSVSIRFEYGDDETVTGELRFDRVRAYRRRAESHCSARHLEAYDMLVEVKDSKWVGELVDAMSADKRNLFEMHHFMIYFDSFGCYEVVAKTWSYRPDVNEG